MVVSHTYTVYIFGTIIVRLYYAIIISFNEPGISWVAFFKYKYSKLCVNPVNKGLVLESHSINVTFMDQLKPEIVSGYYDNKLITIWNHKNK